MHKNCCTGIYMDLAVEKLFSHYHQCEICLSGARQQCDIFLSYTMYYNAAVKHK